MNYNLKILKTFEKAAKPLQKKYPSFKEDMIALFEEMEQNPTCGVSLGGGIRKILVAIASKNKGKSGGARVISYNVVVGIIETDVFLVTIYDKESTETITKEEIQLLLVKNDLPYGEP